MVSCCGDADFDGGGDGRREPGPLNFFVTLFLKKNIQEHIRKKMRKKRRKKRRNMTLKS